MPLPAFEYDNNSLSAGVMGPPTTAKSAFERVRDFFVSIWSGYASAEENRADNFWGVGAGQGIKVNIPDLVPVDISNWKIPGFEMSGGSSLPRTLLIAAMLAAILILISKHAKA